MWYRKLCSVVPLVSEIGFGAWGIGGSAENSAAYGKTDDRESLRALSVAFERGINFFDTADFYGAGHSESLLGRAFAPVREKVVIASKVGMLSSNGVQDFSAAHVRLSVEQSLRRLQSEYIDLYQLHSPPLACLTTERWAIDELLSLKDEGKVHAIGISLRSPQDGAAIVGQLDIASVQVNFNMLDQRARICGLFEECQRAGVGVIIRTPLCFGFLTGNLSENEEFGPLDHRAGWGREQLQRWASAPQTFSTLREKHPGETAAQFSLRYCLSFDCVSTVIPGMLTEQHVEENVKASSLGTMTREELNEIEKIYYGHEFFIQMRSVSSMTDSHHGRP